MSWFNILKKLFCRHEYFVVLTGGSLRNNKETFIQFFSATCIHCGNDLEIKEQINNIHFNDITADTCVKKYSPIIKNRIYSKIKVVNKL